MPIMNLYLISQTENVHYECYTSAIVAAPTMERAKTIHPDGSGRRPSQHAEHHGGHTWVEKASDVSAKLVGKAAEGVKVGVILAAFKSI